MSKQITRDFLIKLGNALKLGQSNKNLLNHPIEDGYELIATMRLFIRTHPNMFYRVSVVYEVLSGKDRSYYKTNLYRTVTFQNIHDTTGGILFDIDKYITMAGEAYMSEDPYTITFEKISIWALPKTFRRNTHETRQADRFFSKYGVLRLERVQGLIDALYYFLGRGHPGTGKSITLPAPLLAKGYKTMASFDAIDIEEQIRIFNELCMQRKGSYFKHRPIVLHTNKTALLAQWTPDKDTIYLYIDSDLYIVVLEAFDDIDLTGRQIVTRKQRHIAEAIYVSYDTEWNWEENDKCKRVTHPALLTYCIVHMNQYLGTEPEYRKFEPQYFIGKDCVIKFLEILVNLTRAHPNKTVYAIAHNASGIEHNFIISAITEWYINAPHYEIRFQHTSGAQIHSFRWKKIEFRDSYLFIPLALAKLHKALALDVAKIEIPIEMLLKARYDDPAYLTSSEGQQVLQYALMDSVVVVKAIVKFASLIREALRLPCLEDLMSFRSASSIIKWWLLTPNGEIAWDSDGIVRLRDTVFLGGRNECFFIGNDKDFLKMRYAQPKKIPFKRQPMTTQEEDPSSADNTDASSDAAPAPTSGIPTMPDVAYAMSIDVTSSYPYSMSSEFLPGDPIRIERIVDFIRLKQILNDPAFIYGIYGKPKFNQPMSIPLVGIKQNGKLIFPNFMSGTQFAFMWDFEFRAIAQHIIEFTDITLITFRKYSGLQTKILSLFEGRRAARASGNDGLAYVYKLLMNSGYGSLGMNYIREISYLAKGKRLETLRNNYAKTLSYEGPNGFTWIVIKKPKQVNSKVFLASYITALSRHLLWKELVRLTEDEGAYLLYCDTDSIIFVDKPEKESYYRDKYRGTDLGSWKIEDVSASWQMVTLKVYRLGNKIRYKGISSTNTDLLTPDGNITNQTDIVIWSLGRDGSIMQKSITKRMSLAYTKGFVSPSGLIWSPIL